MVDHQRRHLLGGGDERAERHLLPARGVEVDIAHGARSELELRLHLQHDVILVLLGQHSRDNALSKGVRQRIVDRRRQDAVAGGDIAIDSDVEQRSGVLLVAGDVGDSRNRLQLVQEQPGPVVELTGVRHR